MLAGTLHNHYWSSYPFMYKDSQGHVYNVYPAEYQGTLNFGLELTHYDRGAFPTEETVAQRIDNRLAGKPETQGVYDTHANLRTGMKDHVRVIKLRPGQPLFRFGSSDNGRRLSGPWWTSKLGFERILLRLESAVAGGSALTLREYARRYSAVAEGWSKMDRVFLGVVQRPILCFMGMGSKQYFFNLPDAAAANKRRQVHVHHGNLAQHEAALTQARQRRDLQNLEEYGDENVQLYLPNLGGRVAPDNPQGFLLITREWRPEEIDQKLSKLARRTAHAARAGVLSPRDARVKRLEAICHELGYEYHHQADLISAG